LHLNLRFHNRFLRFHNASAGAYAQLPTVPVVGLPTLLYLFGQELISYHYHLILPVGGALFKKA